ncbi:MAG TPA: hypothetical protein VGM23_17055, partial [Armatimonadota bacterium]
MDLNYILSWIVLLSCGMLVFRFIRHPLQQRGWMLISVFIPAAMGATALRAPGMAGYVGGLLWAVLM